MSNLVVPKFFGINPPERVEGKVKRFKGIGLKYSLPVPQGEVLKRVIHFLDAGGAAGFPRFQVRLHGAPAHPTHPNMLMNVWEFEDGRDAIVKLLDKWGRVPGPEVTAFEGLEALRLEQQNEQMTKLEKVEEAKEEVKGVLTEIPAEPITDEQPPEDHLNEVSLLVFGVISAAQQVLSTSKPVKLAGHDGYLTDPIAMAELNLSVLKLNQSPFGSNPEADNETSSKVVDIEGDDK